MMSAEKTQIKNACRNKPENINGEISDDDDNNLKPSSHDDEEDSPPPPKIMLYEGTCFRNICGNLYFHWKKMVLIFGCLFWSEVF